MTTFGAARARSIAAVLAIAIASSPFSAGAQEPGRRSLSETLTGEARTKHDIGKILYRDGDYPGALANFRRAYELSKDPRLLWNMAACEKNLHHYARVVELVTRYIEEGEAVLSDEDRREAREFLVEVKKLVAYVPIQVSVSDAEVFVDEVAVGTSPLADPVVLDSGMHRFRAHKPGFLDATDAREIEAGEAAPVRLDLRREVHGGRLVVAAARGDVIAIDGRRMAEGRFDGPVASGGHSVEVSAAGKKKRIVDVSLRDGETREIAVELEREPKVIWPWIVAGGVAVAGAAVAGYFIFKPRDPEPVRGTLTTVELP